MLVSTEMITGFNTDVPHEGHVYHVQTEDGGKDNPSFQSLIYIGGTIVAKKLTPYPEPINEDSRQEKLASLLKRQHQVIIAAIKAGRIEDLIRHSLKQQGETEPENEPGAKPMSTPVAESSAVAEQIAQPVAEQVAQPVAEQIAQPVAEQIAQPLAEQIAQPVAEQIAQPVAEQIAQPVAEQIVQPLAEQIAQPAKPHEPDKPSSKQPTSSDEPVPDSRPVTVAKSSRPVRRGTTGPKIGAPAGSPRGDTAGLNLDQVLEDYVKRGAGHAKLEVKVLTPEVFTAGRGIGLRVQVTHDKEPDFDATVTVKIIGTAFRPQVFIGRVGRDGIASFSLTLPSFSTGTAAIVIEAQSGTGRGELKNLIRRA